MEKIVLFGAGVYAKKYKSLLDFLGIEFDFFSDNDRGKFGTVLYGKQVISPQELVEIDCRIIISCTHGEQIKSQLEEMGISDRLLDVKDIYDLFKRKIVSEEIPCCKSLDEMSVIVDMYEGIGWGGTEIWAATVAKGLKEKGREVTLFGSTEQVCLEQKCETLTERFSSENTIEQMVKSMLCKLPFVLFNNFAGCAYLAAVMLKMQYPDMVKIIDVIHNDNQSLFNAHMVFKDWTDRFLCVSDKIRQRMIFEYGLEPGRVFFKEQPIDVERNYIREYHEDKLPLRVGYAARLVRQQKRSDLFPELIEEFEKEGINYYLEIAGDGECYSQINKSLIDKNLSGKVHLLGRINKSEMPDFWKRQDIYLNFSEYEGTSLSMLEAMSYACVPVVTDVSGVSEFVTDGRNGYVCRVGDLKGIAKAINKLDRNRRLLNDFGEASRKEILKRCKKDDYINYVCKIIDGIEND